VVRAEEFESLAADIEAEARALKLVRERITLCRRDIAKMIATGSEEGVPTRRGGQGPGDWQEVHRGSARSSTRFRGRRHEPVAETLSQLADDVLNLLRSHINAENLSSNESHSGRHIQSPNPDPLIDLEPS
jgi:replication initiation protein RepC